MAENTTTPAEPGSAVLYIGLKPQFVNGVILSGFGSAEVFPGDAVQVRGAAGLHYEHALALVNSGRWFWCDADCREIEPPEPSEAEAAVARASGADQVAGGPGVAYPEHNAVDLEYAGPPEHLENPIPPEQPDEAASTPAPPVSLNVVARSTERRDANEAVRVPENVPEPENDDEGGEER